MIVWRLSNHADLSAIGGMLVSARWHTKGRPILYASEHPALAMLETLAHLDRTEVPSHYQLIAIELPDDAAVELTEAQPARIEDRKLWRRAIGDGWLAAASSLALRVPSFLAPHSWNYLINPAHPDIGKARIVGVDQGPFEVKLLL